MREYRYVVDREGRVFHDGSEIIDPAVLRFFLRSMQRTADGRHMVLCQGEQNWFEASDTPFVVQRIHCRADGGASLPAELVFAGGYSEPLEPSTLEASAGHLYCRVRRGTFRARFGRVAIQQLAPFLIEGEVGMALRLGDAIYPVHVTDAEG